MQLSRRTSNLAKGRIAVLSPLVAANKLVRRVRSAGTFASGGRRELYEMYLCLGTLQWAGTYPPQKYPLPWGFGSPSMVPWAHRRLPLLKRYLNRFSHFCLCTSHPCTQHTDTQTSLRATSVGCSYLGRIYALFLRYCVQAMPSKIPMPDLQTWGPV